ncbi:phytanoyl-CoA dioxygenase family protein [Jiangella alkaliphila]|uniref:Phytanoyl-CoA dioxygenase (PhyH) n=1 Tax=Jiangella alkaliphila TaxID=419479 RepID=A0A1H2JRJ8_9ACTN|nr:phytanoyl-CoA dioxygenase family protein [Jiangella alkaliphila]SDU58992.1 Phytanoyl-CoA dioxygenase (PhyH) [Jiangella alkaliphila]
MLTSNGYVLDESARRLGELQPVPDAERHDRDALWDRLRRDGYLFLRGALDPGDVHGFRAYYGRSVAPSGVWTGAEDRAEYRHILFRQVVPGPEYAAFCAQPAVRDWYAWFLGGETFLHRRKLIRHVRPGESGVGTATQAHYDLVYLREGTDRVLSSWIPLGDCPVPRGGLTYLEGCHHRVMAQERAGTLKLPATSITADLPGLADEHDARWLVADYEAGDMVVHSAYTVHAALDNVDDDYRLSTDIRYQRAADPIDWRWQQHWHDRDGL